MMVQIVMKTENPPKGLEGVKVLKGHSIIEMPQSEYIEKYDEISRIMQENNIEWYPRLVLWESGGATSSKGYAKCIAKQNGDPMKPVFVRERGNLANSDHAMFVAKKAAICEVSQWAGENIKLSIVKIKGKKIMEEELWNVEDINYDKNIVPKRFVKYIPLIDATVNKAHCYHCRSPHYMVEN